jgi:Right handed beta helix region
MGIRGRGGARGGAHMAGLPRTVGSSAPICTIRSVVALATIAGVLRLAAIAITAAAATACIARERLVCEHAEQCSAAAGGVCHEGGCAYPDGECASGLRYSELAGERAGRCVDDDVADDGGSSSTAVTTGDVDGSASSGETTTAASTSIGESGPIPSVCDDVACSGAGTCVVIDDAPSCACDSGHWMRELECVLDPCDEVACFYVDATLGDDANGGTIDAPWRTLERLGSAIGEAAPGDHFLLRRGAVWGDADGGYRLRISAAIGTPDAPIVIGGYGPLADGRPRLAPGNVQVIGSSHVVLRDLDIADDPDDPAIFDLFGNRPCVLVQDSDYVLVLDNLVSQCNARGIWVAYGSSYSAIVGNVVSDADSEGITVTDITWLDPVIRVGPHHWILDNRVERVSGNGISIGIGSQELELGDAKVVRNRIADVGTDGVSASTTGFAWVVDNVIARAGGIEPWQGSVSIATRSGGQLSGNVVFENAGNGIIVQYFAEVVGNTVIHDGSVGDALAVDDNAQLTAARNLLWARGDRAGMHVLAGVAGDHVVALDDGWYVGIDEAACSFVDGGGTYDLAGWRAATGFDLSSSCGPVAGLGDFAPAVPASQWDATFMQAFTPDASWSGCAEPTGARDCDGAAIGPPIAPFAGLDDESEGLGWPGPLEVRQRYDLAK